MTLSAVAHAGLLAAIILARPYPGPPADAPPFVVAMIDLKPPELPPAPLVATPTPPATPTAAPKPEPKRANPKRAAPKPQPSPSPVEAAPEAPVASQGTGLSDAQLAGAATAESGPAGGGGGGGCNMARRLQAALRRDTLVQAAVARAGSRAIMVWDGDWVQHGEEDGKGLAAVREAIMWEIAFAPAACKAEPMRGLLVLSMNEGSARLALGQGDWRWTDLLRSGR